MKKLFFSLLIFVSSFFILRVVFSANTDIVINEIGAYPASTHEWMEIWNKGAEPVDMTGWKFWESNTNHGLSVSTTDAIVAPGEYAAICQDSEQFLLDNPGFAGSVFDSSWGSLSESGEEVGLKDGGENFVEQFTYLSASNHSLERANPFLADYSAANWQENADGNTLGLVNSNFLSVPAPDVTSTPTTTPPPTTTPESGPLTSSIWAQIKINEFVSYPQSGNEWVELYNSTTGSLDLVGGYVCDSRNTTTTCKHLLGTISGSGLFVFDLGTDSYLNNDGDSVILKNPEATEVDSIIYNDALAAAKGQSLARRSDGADTDNNADWAITTQLTPGAANNIAAPVITPPSSGGGNSQTPLPTPLSILIVSSSAQITSSSVVLNELYPYPDEDDEEFIEIKNNASGSVSLSGWKVADKTRSFTLSGNIGPGEIKYFDKPATNISLNNSTPEEVRLIGPQGQIFGSVKYEKAGKGLSYSRDELGRWLWTEAVTRGEENKITLAAEEDKSEAIGLLWRLKYKPLIKQGEGVLFDASRSLDPRGGRIAFAWDFGEGAVLFGDKPIYNFSSSGPHELIVRATSTAGTTDQKKIKIKVYPAGEAVGAGVVIGEIAPNEANNEEYIRIKNIGSEFVNISNWKIIANEKVFNIPTGTILTAKDDLTFYKTITNFTLSNAGGLIELRMADDVLADAVSYGKSSAGDKYILAGDEWIFVKAESPAAAGQTKTAAKISTKKYTPIVFMGIAQAREAEKDDGVKVRGVVAVKPGVFGVQYFYITDGAAGIQIYQYKKDFPELAVGDLVEVKGIISIASDAKRIKVQSGRDIDILSTGNSVSPLVLDISEADEDAGGALIKIAGEITEIKSNFMYLDDGTDEAVVYFKRGAGIDKKKFKEGDLAEITGVVGQSNSGVQIWPRSQDDIQVTGESEDLLKKQAVAAANQSGDTTEKYLTATAGGITTLLLGFLVRARGAMAAGFIKKIGSAAISLIKKNKA